MSKGDVQNIRQLGLCSECLIECPKAKTRHGCDGAIPKKIFLQIIQGSLDIHMMLKEWTDPPSSVKRRELYRLQKEEEWRRIWRESTGG